jgi:hypothetical protein
MADSIDQSDDVVTRSGWNECDFGGNLMSIALEADSEHVGLTGLILRTRNYCTRRQMADDAVALPGIEVRAAE